MAGGSEKAVYAAIAGNTAVMLAKFGAFFASGSPAMLSEGIHSLADVGNQALLALGIRKSNAPPQPGFPYGFHRDRYVWALISAVGIFFLGCGVTVYHGVSSLLHPHYEPGGAMIAFGVLLFSLIVEGWTLLVAFRHVNSVRGDVPLGKFLRETSDPMASAVLLEDGAAVLGVLMAAVGIGLTEITGNPVFDSLTSIFIGLLLGLIAIALIRRNRELLLGERVQDETVERMVTILKDQPEVDELHEVRAVVLGSGALRLAADIDFDGKAIARTLLKGKDLDDLRQSWDNPAELQQWLEEFGEAVIDQLSTTVDRIEEELIHEIPELTHVALEAD
ncbi:MAG: cation diffusion facilitator family transporter [Deltaproteobacteria bacterium]|nr:cation diffusion facilitator family transporter [Deltaproteobacteria bacterium]